MYGFIDISYDEIKKYLKLIEESKRKEICKILPDARFYITSEGLFFNTLVCSKKMGGKCTGIGAQYCKNCILKEKNG